jgi:hypothetical protein
MPLGINFPNEHNNIGYIDLFLGDAMQEPPKWTEIYPQGTKAGDEEQAFFIALARNSKWAWRSTAALSKEANLTKERVEELLNKYYKKGMVFQNPANEDQWGYWTRVPEMLKADDSSITDKDHEDRIKKAIKP